MMPPYGTPYAAMYSHGYAHPAVPLVSLNSPYFDDPTFSSELLFALQFRV